jgi:streptogramin lyase
MRHFPAVTSRLLVLALVASGLGFLAPALTQLPAQAAAQASATGTITSYSLSGITTTANPQAITPGPNGTVAFTDGGSGQIGVVTPTVSTPVEYAQTPPLSSPSGIVTGTDGNFYFTEEASGTNQIGVMAPSGAHVTTISGGLTTNSEPTAITRATDGRLWFTQFNPTAGAEIGEVTGTGNTATLGEVPITGATATQTFGIAPDASGGVWVTIPSEPTSQIAHVSSAGTPQVYSLSGSALGLTGVAVSGSTVYLGEAGSTPGNGNGIMAFNASTGLETGIVASTAGTEPISLTMGPDGNLYFTNALNSDIEQVTPAGVMTSFPTGATFSFSAEPDGITVGPDGNIWATAQGTAPAILQMALGSTPTTPPTLAASPTSLSFATQTVGTTSAAQSVTVTASGGGSATVTAVSATGPFAVSGCASGTVLSPSCTASITFTPTAAGAASGTFTVTDTDGVTATASLSGIGGTTTSGGGGSGGSGSSGAVTGTVSPAAVNFGNQSVGTTGTAIPIALVNSGTTTMTVSGVQVTGTEASDFTIVQNACSGAAVTVTAGSFCYVEVEFTPKAEGIRAAFVQFTFNGSNSPVYAVVYGRGVHQAGYWLVASDGGIFNYGPPFLGSAGAIKLNKPIVGMASTPDSGGYWLVATDGGIFSYGDAKFFGSTGSINLNKPIVGMASTPDGGGYWLVASDGGIFSYGDAKFYGSTGSIKLNKPIVGMESTPDGGGYWLVATDGGIFAYGDAKFFGSTGSINLNKPIVGMTTTPDGAGYWLVASDGGIFSYGSAVFHGSAGSIHLNKPIVGMASTPAGIGYWLVATDGGIFSYGDAAFFGSTGSINLNKPIVGMAPAL